MAAGNTNNVTARLRLTGQRAFSTGMRQVTDDSSKARRGFAKIGGAAKTMGKNVGGAAVALGTFGVAAAAGLGAKFIKDAEESRKIGRLTEQVIKSTGKAAKVSAKHVGDLAGSISNKTGVDDEAIQSGANMLLTFTNIRNETGKGGKVFDRATQAITDMGAAMGKDPVKSSVMLGKALNDPVKGVTALSKVGVTFNDGQKKQIATFMKQGKTAKAQGVILDELAKEFGGAAAAQGSATDKLRVQFGNISEDIGTLLLPYVDRFATWMGSRGIPLMKQAAAAAGKYLAPSIRFITTAFDRAQPVLTRVGSWLKKVLLPAAQQGRGSQIDGLRKGWESLSASFKRNSPWLKAAAARLLALVKVALPAWVKIQGKLSGKALEGLGHALGLAIDGARLAMVGMSKFGRFTVNTFGSILHAAAKAFGWVPKLGDKLKAADAAFATFRDNANKAFDEIDASLKVKVDATEFDKFIRRSSGPLPVILPPSSIAAPGRSGANPIAPRAPVKPGAKRSSVAVNNNVVVNLDGRRVSKEQSRVQAARRAWQ